MAFTCILQTLQEAGGRFWSKMTKIGIQNPKIIVTNDYQKFWAHFD